MLVPVATAPACGCGAMVPNGQAEGARVDEWSIVRFSEGREEIAMRLASSREFDQAALIMPVPSRATFALGDDADFTEIEARTRPRVETKKRYSLFGDGGGITAGGADDGARPGGGVSVIDEQDLGPLRIVTLRGDDASAVGRYLERNGYTTPEGLEPIAQEYLDEGWLLVAARLRAARGESLITLQPLVIRFASEELVYPLRMSRLAPDDTQARVDLITDEPQTVENWPSDDVGPEDAPGEGGRLYGGPYDEGQYLSSFRFTMDGDEAEDPRFAAAERDDFRQVRYQYDDVAIGGWILLGLFVVVVLLAGLVAATVLRRRRTASS